jgi:DNA helicase-2/ATP-dependent DNA helicase PcrA
MSTLREKAGIEEGAAASSAQSAHEGAGPLFAGVPELEAREEPTGEATDGLRPIIPLIMTLLSLTDFREHLKKAHPGDHDDRDENVEALVSAAAEYDEQAPGMGLQGFLDRSSLRSDTDDVKGDTGITLLTIHSAKGLEFSDVVIAGLEEDLFPHIRSRDSGEELEEERRLCYVAITRAKQRLVLTNAQRRRSFGNFVENRPSRFLDEIPKQLLKFSESAPWPAFTDESSEDGPGFRNRHGSGGSYRFGRGYGSSSAGVGAAGRGFRPRRPQGAASSEPGGDDFAVGRLVTHPMFGRGKILHKEGAGDTLKLTIRFQDGGTKVIVLKHTTLVVHD